MWRRVVGAVSAVSLVCLVSYGGVSPGNSSRRLVANVVTTGEVDGEIIDIFDNAREGFKQWMSNAGLEIFDEDSVSLVHTKFLKRVLMMCHDILPSSVMAQYEEDFAEVGHIDLSATRPLTQAEGNMKDYFQLESLLAPRASLRAGSKAARYGDFFPDDLGRAIPGGDPVTYETKCWHKVIATTEKVSDGYNVHLTASRPKSLIPYRCTDFYLLATPSQVSLAVLPSPVGGTKTYHFKTSKLTESEHLDLETNGVRLFLFRDGPINVVQNLLETVLLFTSELTQGVGDKAAKRNVDFLERYAGITMNERTDSGDLMLDESEIQSGDFFGVIRLDGLDPILAWAMGSHTGHTVVALREDDQLYIAESTAKGSYWPTNGIQRTPYRQWIDQAREAGFAVVHAPLAAKYRAMFDEKAANAFFHNVDGIDYGYGSLLVGWIDTENGNFPCLPAEIQSTPSCLLASHVEILLPIAAKFIAAAESIFLPAWNVRITGNASSGLSATEILHQASSQGIASQDIFPIVEQDSTLYPQTFNNGTVGMAPAMVCDVFVCNVWKAAGLFQEIDNDFNCGEQTNTDVYNLDILAAPEERPAACVVADPDNDLCQLVGKYQLTLPTLGTRAPYKHMQDHCPFRAPEYERPDDC